MKIYTVGKHYYTNFKMFLLYFFCKIFIRKQLLSLDTQLQPSKEPKFSRKQISYHGSYFKIRKKKISETKCKYILEYSLAHSYMKKVIVLR